jgi:hypothetical protein
MFIVGVGFYGKVDRVPGQFYVVTRFFHLYWVLPLFPVELRSYLVFEGPCAPEHRICADGVPIPLSIKSLLFAWARGPLAGLGLLWIGSLGFWIHAGVTGDTEWRAMLLTDLILVGVSFVSLGLLWGTYKLSRASPARAARLMALLEKRQSQPLLPRELAPGAPSSEITKRDDFKHL